MPHKHRKSAMSGQAKGKHAEKMAKKSHLFRALDLDNDGHLNEEEWVYGMSVLLKGTMEEQQKFCFAVYDLNNDGFVSREEMFHFLKNTLVVQQMDEDPDEGIKELVEFALKKMDQDHDGKLSFSDYKETLKEDDLLKEFLGACIPDAKTKESFLQTISNVYPKVPQF
ncbi:hypothetical protein KUTeg_008621 [Tegillarca granosa]|uniref:EF-hand domain-containing protein n=1 Tax=Tegillarca granosa TaxID=220873 RepID=A0ABQ9F9P7_TEGGR|nr:hypothetical protein KUTeg_008621 [Tegillarca granosa]